MRIFCASITSLIYDGDEVVACAETLHDLNVERLETETGSVSELDLELFLLELSLDDLDFHELVELQRRVRSRGA
jgi:hypothetical protein